MIGSLQVNGVYLDLKQGTPIPLNYSIADIKEPQKRKRNFSKTISLPGTSKNLDFFSSTYLLSLSTVNNTTNIGFDFDPTLRVKAKYYSSEGDLIFDGLFQLNEVSIVDSNYTFKCTLFSNFIDLFMKLGDLKVSELGWGEYNHNLTRTNIVNSWDTSVKVNGSDTSNFSAGLPLGFGYHYGMVDYGYSATSTMTVSDLVPMIYWREVFEKCLKVSDIVWQSTFLDSELFRKLLLGFGGGEKQSYPASEIALRRCSITGSMEDSFPTLPNRIESNGFILYSSYGKSDILRTLDNNATLVTDLSNQYFIDYTNLGAGSYQTILIRKGGKYRLNIDLDITIPYVTGTMVFEDGTFDVKVEVEKNGTVIDSKIQPTSTTYTGWDAFNYKLDKVYELVNGDQIKIYVTITSYTHYSLFNIYSNPEVIEPFVDCTINTLDLTCVQSSLQTNDLVNVERFIPDMKASDFLSAVILAFNLYMEDPNYSGISIIEPLNDYYQPTTEFLDITDIVDHSKEIVIKPASTIDGKRYIFKWAVDNDYDNKEYYNSFNYGYGDHTYTVPSTFQTGERVYQLPFAQSLPQVYTSPFVRPRIVSFDGINAKPFKGKPRVYVWNGLKSGAWRLEDSDHLAWSDLTTYPCVHHFDNYENPTFDLNWGLPLSLRYPNNIVTTSNLYTVYHQKFLKEITGKDSKIVSLYAKLNSNHIFNLDFSKLIMWNGVLFKLNEIKDFDPNVTTSTQIELIRIIEASNPITGQIDYPEIDEENTGIHNGGSGAGTGTGVYVGGNNDSSLNAGITRGN